MSKEKVLKGIAAVVLAAGIVITLLAVLGVIK